MIHYNRLGYEIKRGFYKLFSQKLKFSSRHSQNRAYALSVASQLIFAHVRALRSCIAECAHSCEHDSPILRRMAELFLKNHFSY